MKYLIPTSIAVVTTIVIFGIWECAGSPYFGLGIRTPFESATEYHLRMMYYHGRETKDGQDAAHGREIVALGEQAVPDLVQGVSRYSLNPRFDPPPHEMLAHFPATAHDALARQISELKSANVSATQRTGFLLQRTYLSAAIIYISNDWSYLDQWLADNQELADGFYFESVPTMRPMLRELLKGDSAPEPFNRYPSADSLPINPEFVNWWKVNGPRIVARENAKGFQNAKR